MFEKDCASGYHALRIDVLGIRQYRYKNHDGHDLASQMVYHLEGLSGEVYLHLLANDGIEMKGLLVLLAPLGVVLTELPVG